MENLVYIFGRFYNQEEHCSRQKFLEIMEQAHNKVHSLQNYPVEEILRALEKIGNCWKNKDYPHRKNVFAYLTDVEHKSPEAANRDLDIVPQILNYASLRKRLSMSLPYPVETLDNWYRPVSFSGKIRAKGQGVVVHICAGNVFLGALDSLVMGIITKNVNIVKLSSHDPGALLHFAQSLQEEDSRHLISQSVAILKWSRGDKEMEEVALENSNMILVWGGEDAIREYKTRAASSVKVAGYGPRISFGVISERAFQEEKFEDIASRCARDICIYDQKACASPQNIFIPACDKSKVMSFMQILDNAMERELKSYPPSQMNPNELAEIIKHKETMKYEASQGWAWVQSSPNNDGYTLVFSEHPGLQPSPLYRFVYLKPYFDLDALVFHLKDMGFYLQTAGLYATPSEWAEIEHVLTSSGVTRVAELGQMLDVNDGAPHDGEIPLMHLVRWLVAESGSRLPNHPEIVKEFLTQIRENSPFYRKFWQNVNFEADDFLRQIPLLSKDVFYENTPPDSQDIFTLHPPQGAIIFSSGGSTGRPKYSYFTNQELDIVSQGLADHFLLSGLSPKDVVANLFVAGHLWSSFLVVDRYLNKIGVTNLPIGGHLEFDEIAKYLAAFKPTALIGLPSGLSGLLHHCIEKGIQLQIEKVFYGGEHIAPSMIAHFQKYWGTKLVHSAGYASVDAGIIGYQCAHQTGGWHHLYSDLILMELISPDGKVIETPGEEGEIVVTALYRKLMPIVRYRTGDLGVYDYKECPCGLRDPVFRLIGRCDNRLQIGGARIFVEEIDSILQKYEFLTGVYQFVPQYRNGEEFLQIFLEYAPSCGSQKITEEFLHDFREQEFWGEFRKVFTDIALSVEQKWIAKPEIQFVKEGTIPRLPRTGKVKLIQDKRL